MNEITENIRTLAKKLRVLKFTVFKTEKKRVCKDGPIFTRDELNRIPGKF